MLAPGSTIGILGGGQLARMMALAAAPLGLRVHIYAPEADCPAGDVAYQVTRAAYDDTQALDEFAGAIDALTYEFENVPVEAAARIGARVPAHPDPGALSVAQDRVTEKTFLNSAGIPTASFVAIAAVDEIPKALARLGLPAILKTRRLGYDGKGQVLIRDEAMAAQAFAAIGAAPAILEGFVRFEREISVIAARNEDGQTATFDPSWNQHSDHILRRSLVPCGLSAALIDQARQMAIAIADALHYVGVLGVEFFVTDSGLLVNEIAPRVHNSGHWTLDGCSVSQFEQHIRCVAGWPLGPTTRHSDAIMDNLIGDDVLDWPKYAADLSARLHLYGKGAPSPGRKMGHVTRLYRLDARPDEKEKP
jgi:5-(carboxyamino)imidazole ribonucleotide synthase